MSGNSAYIKHRCQSANARESVYEQIKNYKDHKVCNKAEHNIAAINLNLQSLLFFSFDSHSTSHFALKKKKKKKRRYCASTQKIEPNSEDSFALWCG